MLIYNYRYLIAVLLVIVFWGKLQQILGAQNLHPVLRNFFIPVVLVVLLSELLGYLDRRLTLNLKENMRVERQPDGYDPMGSGATNVTSQKIKNGPYYAQMNQQISEVMNPVLSKDDEDNEFVNTPDNAGLVGEAPVVEHMDGGDSTPQISQAQMDEAANEINVPVLPSVVPSNAVAADTNDYNNRLGCMTGNGPCHMLCSKPQPENPCDIVAPIPGGPWQPQSASTVYNRLANGKYVPSTCDITKMELIRRGDIPQSAQ